MKTTTGPDAAASALDELERSVYSALETYSNVHRGSGHDSAATTRLFETARDIVLEHAGLPRRTHDVVFCAPRTAERLRQELGDSIRCTVLSSADLGLPLGVRALVVPRDALRRCAPVQTGGGTARLVAFDWVIWAQAPDRFEAGTPAIVNVVAFAQALRLADRHALRTLSASGTEATASPTAIDDGLAGLAGAELLGKLRSQLIGRDVRVPTLAGDRAYVNLDNGASTPTFEPIWQAARTVWHEAPEARHRHAEETSSVIASMLGAPATEYEVIFTSNTTEAINLVAESVRREARSGAGRVVVNSLLEHNSNELPWRATSETELVRIGFDADGFIDLDALEAELRERNRADGPTAERVSLVAVSGASNVLGVYNDLAAIAEISHRHGARLLVDAAQLVAHRPVEMAGSGIDYLAFSAHKAYAPFGTGVLVARRGLLDFTPAEIAEIRASGEENVTGIAALGQALRLLQRIGFGVIQAEEQSLTRRALQGLSRLPNVRVFGISDPSSAAFARKGGVIPFNVAKLVSHGVARELAARGGIGVRSGCHCAHLTVKRILEIPPWVQTLQGVIVSTFRSLELPGVVRVSFGIENTADDVDRLLDAVAELAAGSRLDRAQSRAGQERIDAFSADVTRRVFAPGV